MRTFFLIAAFAVSAAATFSAQHCQAQWPGTTRGSNYNHFIEVSGKAYDRPGVDSDDAVVVDATTGSTLFSAEDATDGGNAPGLEITYGFEGPLQRQWEFRTILAEFQNDTAVSSLGGLGSPLFGGATPQDFSYEYDTRLLSFELLSYRQIAPGIRFGAGPRYLSYTETAEATASSPPPPAPPGVILPPTSTTSFQEGSNGLIGIQAGLDLRLPISQQIYATGFIRTGGFYNPTEVTSSLAGVSTSETKSTGSFLAEVGGRVYFDIFRDSISAYAGYEATWIDGIALAPAQFLNPPGAGVDTSNTLFFQAVTFGLRMNF